MSADWDWDAQRADTAWTIEHLIETQDLTPGMIVTLEVQTIAADTPDRDAYIAALKDRGYGGSAYANDDGEETIEVSIPDTPFTEDAIWAAECAVTKIALSHGYQPDGWGFWEPE
ncbi:MAG: hypothetical protein AAF439_16080 [Pseudomonadota bacterium]